MANGKEINNVKPIKEFIAEQFMHKKFHFKCNCLMPIDVVGRIVDYEIINNEIIWSVDSYGKIIKIGENHPNMEIE